jgi:mono/diheme cytochrome c family protein
MPPVAFKLTLTDTQIETIRKWIEAGAPSRNPQRKSEPDEELTRFEKQALPILSAKCVSCHGAGPRWPASICAHWTQS